MSWAGSGESRKPGSRVSAVLGDGKERRDRMVGMTSISSMGGGNWSATRCVPRLITCGGTHRLQASITSHNTQASP